MRYIIAHSSPDWDAITSVWLLKRYFPGWENAEVQFVPAGERWKHVPYKAIDQTENNPIEDISGVEVIHVDTGLGPLDHHQTSDRTVCAASLCWDFVQKMNPEFALANDSSHPQTQLKWQERTEALHRIVQYMVTLDHFREVFWPNAASDIHEFTFYGILQGLKVEAPDQDRYYVDFGMVMLDAMLHRMENRIWAEREIKEKGKEFATRFGKGLGIETLNDDIIKLAQKMGYEIVIRKDPRKGYVRIKALPEREGNKGADLTLVYEQLSKMDPNASWFLHVSKKMLLNGSAKSSTMVASKLSLDELISVLKKI